MQNKTLTPPKSLRSYLDLLHNNNNSSRKRKSIFSHSRAPSASKTPTKSFAQETTMDRSKQQRVATEPLQQRTTEELISEMSALLGTIKGKYNVYVQAEQQNTHLKKENAFLKQELARLRQVISQNSSPENNVQSLKARNSILQERFNRARKQLKQLKRLYSQTGDISSDLERVCDLLQDDSITNSPATLP